MSRILIVGSSRGPDAALFESTCRRLGALLAGRGHELVVCSDAPEKADRLAVEGANGQGRPDSPARVTYFASAHDAEDAASDDFAYPPRTFPHVTRQLRLTNSGWFATYNAAIGYADAVIAVSGSPRGTGGALYIALAKATPVLAIPAAEGFSQEIWKEFAHAYGTLPDDDRVKLQGRDPDEIAAAAVRSVEQLIERNPFPAPRHGLRYSLLPLAMIAFGAAWIVLTFVVSSQRPWLPWLVATVMALAGMLFRYANDDARRQEAYAGSARVFKDLTRVLGALLGAFLVIRLFSLQTQSKTTDSSTLLAAWLAVLGFAAGFLVEEFTGMLTRALSSVVGAGLKGGK